MVTITVWITHSARKASDPTVSEVHKPKATLTHQKVKAYSTLRFKLKKTCSIGPKDKIYKSKDKSLVSIKQHPIKLKMKALLTCASVLPTFCSNHHFLMLRSLNQTPAKVLSSSIGWKRCLDITVLHNTVLSTRKKN